MSDREVAKRIAAAFIEQGGEYALIARRREIRAQLAEIPNGTATTPEIDAFFDELDELVARDSGEF